MLLWIKHVCYNTNSNNTETFFSRDLKSVIFWPVHFAPTSLNTTLSFCELEEKKIIIHNFPWQFPEERAAVWEVSILVNPEAAYVLASDKSQEVGETLDEWHG